MHRRVTPMCRFALYLGPPITLDSLLMRAENSLLCSNLRSHQNSDLVDNQGLGVAWYARGVAPHPAVFKSVTPAWNGTRLRGLARVTRSGCILVFARVAPPGAVIGETNCQPFSSKAFAFMHDGSVAGFSRVKRALVASLSDEAIAQIEGSTDSEHLFAVFMDEFRAAAELSGVERMAEALTRTIQKIVELTWRAGIEEPSFLNLAVADGRRAVVSRFASGGQTIAQSLYLGTRHVYGEGTGRVVRPDEADGAILISSEPLSDGPGWLAVPSHSLVVVREDQTAELRPYPQPPLVCAV